MRRIYLIGLILLMTVVVIVGGGLMYLNGSLGSDQVLALVNRTVLHRAGMELQWRRASGSFLFNLVVDEPVLCLTEGDTLVRAERMKIGLRPWSLVEGEVEITRIEADGPVVDLLVLAADSPEQRAERSENRRRRREERLAAAATDSGSAGESRPIRIRNVVLRDGEVRFGSGGVVHAVRGVRIRSDLVIGAPGGLAFDIRRLRGVLADWGLVIENLDGGLVIDDGYLRFSDTRVRTRSARLVLEGDLDLRPDRADGDLELDLQARDLSEWWPILGGTWPGEGALEIHGRLRRLPWEPDLELQGSGTIAALSLEDWTLEGTVRPGAITADLTTRGAGAWNVTARIQLDPRSGVGRIQAAVDSLDLGLTPAGVPLQAVRAEVDLETAGFDPVAEGGRIEATLVGVDLSGVNLDTVGIDMDLGQGGLRTRVPLRMTGEGFRLQAEGELDLDRGAIDVDLSGTTGATSALLIGAGVPLDAGEIALGARVTGAIRNPSVRGNATCVALEQGGLSIHEARLRVNIAQVFGDRIGTFGAELDSLNSGDGISIDGVLLDGRITGERVVLQLMSGWWQEGEASLHGNVTLAGDSLRARVDTGRFLHRDLDITHLAGDFSLHSRNGAGPFSLTTRFAGGGAAEISGSRNAEHEVQFRLDLTDLEMAPILASVQTDTLALSGRIGGTMRGRIGQHLESLAVRAVVRGPSFETEVWEQLDLEAAYAAGSVQLDRLVLVGSEAAGRTGGRLEVTGSLTVPDPNAPNAPGSLDLQVLTTEIQLGALDRYLPGVTLRGDLSSQLQVGGTFVAPIIRGEAGVREAQIDTFEITELTTRIALDSGSLQLRNGRLASLGFGADFQGSMPLELAFVPFTVRVDTAGAIAASLRGQGSTAVLIQPLREQIEDLEGDLTVEVELAGTLADPLLDGSVQLVNGRLKPVTLGQAIEDLQVALSLSEARISIDRFTGRLPPNRRYRKRPGDFSLTGAVELGGAGGRTRYDLTFHGEALGVSEPTGSIFADLDTELHLRTASTAPHPVLEGTVEVRQALADVGMILDLIGAGGSGRPEADGRETGFEINVEIDIPGRFNVVGGELGQDVDVELVGDLILRKNPLGEPYLLGTLEAVPGRGQLFAINRRWSVDEAIITFGSIEEINPDLNARFLTDVEDIRVILTLTGDVREPLIQWSTEGDVLTSEWDIYQLLALGAIGMGQQAGGARRVVGDFIENAVSRSAQALPFVDTVETEGVFNRLTGGSLDESAQVSVGKYIGSSLYLRYSRSLGGTTLWDEWRTEYRISRRFRLTGTYDRYGRLILELKWRIEY